MAFIVLLACVWLYLAYDAFTRGDMTRAGIYILIGVALTAWRVTRNRARQGGNEPPAPAA